MGNVGMVHGGDCCSIQVQDACSSVGIGVQWSFHPLCLSGRRGDEESKGPKQV